MSDLSFFDVGADSRSNSFEEKRNDANQHEQLQDPLHIPSGPITRARSKKIKEAFIGLIQEIWTDSIIPKCVPKATDKFVNLIHACEDMG